MNPSNNELHLSEYVVPAPAEVALSSSYTTGSNGSALANSIHGHHSHGHHHHYNHQISLPLVYDLSVTTLFPLLINGTTDLSSSSRNFSSNIDDNLNDEWIDIIITIFKASIMIFIIVAAIFGNLLVIISVMRVRKLR